VTLKFNDLNPLGRAIILVVAALTFGVAAVSFATSYGALYAYARDTGLYSERLTRLWPLLLDGAFIVAQLAAILAGILRGSRGWPILTMLLTGALTIWFNLQHAGNDPGRRLAAALPPLLMMLAFEIDIQIVRWVMAALGRPLGPITPPPRRAPWPARSPVPSGGRTAWAGTFRRRVHPTAGPRAWSGRSQQVTPFRKTRRTDKPGWQLGRAVTRPGSPSGNASRNTWTGSAPTSSSPSPCANSPPTSPAKAWRSPSATSSRSSTPSDPHPRASRRSGGGAGPASRADDRRQATPARGARPAAPGTRT
jgi:hypothetical protein